jgi:hypothetical protein
MAPARRLQRQQAKWRYMADDQASSGLMLQGNKQDGFAWKALATRHRIQTESMSFGCETDLTSK